VKQEKNGELNELIWEVLTFPNLLTRLMTIDAQTILVETQKDALCVSAFLLQIAKLFSITPAPYRLTAAG
jgi:hypothetical protein